MNIKKIIKGMIGLGVVSGIAYAAFKVGENSGEINERFRDKYDDEEDDDDIVTDDEDDIRFYDNMDEPDDGCLASVGNNHSQEVLFENECAFEPIEKIHIKGITLGQLRGLLLHLTMLKNFHKKDVKEYLCIDDDTIIALVIDAFTENGYICKRDKYKYHVNTSISDCSNIISSAIH